MTFKHVDSETSQWLAVEDAFLSSRLTISQQSLNILEIGIYTGAWSIDMLLNNPKLIGFGIDPFPGMQDIEAIMSANMSVYGVSSRFKHFQSYESLETNHGGLKYAVIHIDGEHTERAVNRDLKFAASSICDDGLIIVDDIFHSDFPGIASSVFNFLSKENYCSFLLTSHKMYICRKEYYEKYRTLGLNILEDSGFSFNLGNEQIYGIYQDNSVSGYPQIKVRGTPISRKSTRFIGLKIYKQKSFSIKIAKKYLAATLEAILPGLLYVGLRNLLRK
jgi:hypothetical protein